MYERVAQIVVEGDEVGWRSALLDLVRVEQMDPWNLNITELASHFLNLVKTMKEMDLRLSGKMVLAAAILLRLKSEKLLSDDLNEFDRMLAESENIADDFFDEMDDHIGPDEVIDRPKEFKLMPRTPQPRKRKISIYDLVDALEKALEVKRRRVRKKLAEAEDANEVKIPQKKIDIHQAMEEVMKQIVGYFDEDKANLKFSELVPNTSRDAKVYTFMPLLYLRNQAKVELHQDGHFDDFEVELKNSDLSDIHGDEQPDEIDKLINGEETEPKKKV